MTILENSSSISSGTSSGGAGGTVVLDHSHPLYLHPSDGHGSMNVGLLLTGMENYTLWCRAMKIALLGKNKLCLVNGTTSKSDFGADLAKQWDRYNAIVTS